VVEALAQTPGALADVRYAWEEFWLRDDQIVSVEELEQFSLIIFGGPRGCGKTHAAVQLFMREIHAGRATRPRIIAGTEADIDKTVVHGPSGLMTILPRELRPTWIKTEGGSGVLRCSNGVEILCFSATQEEQLVGTASDLDLLDDVAKWGPRAERVWNHARVSCRLGNANAIVATTRRGSTLLRKMLKGDISGVLTRRPVDVRANRANLTARYFDQMKAELGGTDFWQQEGDDEDISAESPFAGLDFDAAPIRILEVKRQDIAEIIVAADPADGKGGDHDEWGIGAAARLTNGHIVGLDDWSGSYDDDEAGGKIIDLCSTWGAVKVVGEGNRGVQRLQSVIRAAHYRRELEARSRGAEKPRPLPELVPVTAREGKKLRAGPLRALYLEGALHHVVGLKVLERQQREWDPDGPKRPRQDDRIDWWVHAVHHLADFGSKAHGTDDYTTARLPAEQRKNAIPDPVDDYESDTDDDYAPRRWR
jgi:phage terminase large subunit-like protein